jgi:hypothetical protein
LALEGREGLTIGLIFSFIEEIIAKKKFAFTEYTAEQTTLE